MKDTLNRQVKDLCKIADEVLKDPSRSPHDMAKRIKLFNYTSYIVTLGALGGFAGPIGATVGAAVGACLCGLIGKYIKIKRDASEKERMLKEVIKKQNAVAEKLAKKERLLKQEIENLKQMLAMLENVANAIDKK